MRAGKLRWPGKSLFAFLRGYLKRISSGGSVARRRGWQILRTADFLYGKAFPQSAVPFGVTRTYFSDSF